MNKLIEKLAVQSLVEVDGELIFSKEKFAKMILQECFDILSDQKNYNQCISTTFDQGLAACVTEKSIEAICKNFNVTRTYGVGNERIVG